MPANNPSTPFQNIAHTRNDIGKEQSMREHTKNVANLAKIKAPQVLQKAAYIAGLYHDLGKYNPDFQAYLQSQQNPSLPNCNSVNHKAFGALWLLHKYSGETPEGMTSTEASLWRELIARCIAGHHGGLTSIEYFHKRQCEQHYQEYVKTLAVQEQDIATELGDLLDINIYDSRWTSLLQDPRYFDMLYRVTFSALVDADGTDTQQHYEPNKKDFDLPSLQDIYPIFIQHHNAFSQHANHSPLNQARQRFVKQAIASSSLPPGWFQMNMPTGSGKTLASMRFALEHAQHYGQKRIITVVPFLTITEQNAEVYRKAFGPYSHALLEHHSGKDSLKKRADMTHTERLQYRENIPRWDSSVILTTLVQFVGTISHNKISHLRRLHRLANSVIIIDEAQTIPTDILSAVLNMLNFFVEHCNTTVVLTTATHAAYNQVQDSPITAQNCRSVVSEDTSGVFNRVTWKYLLDKPYTHSEMAHIVSAQSTSTLTIVNSKDDAKQLSEEILNLSTIPVIHLSTYMCKAHRQELLQEIKDYLANDEQIHVISTQLIEAGVDLDFPKVYRAIAPLESLVQASGRCNREGKLPTGETTVFLLDKSKMPPGAYKTAAVHTQGKHIRSKLEKGEDPFSLQAIYDYFASLYPYIQQDKVNKSNKPLSILRQELDFPAIQETMRIIDYDMLQVVVPYRGFIPDNEALTSNIASVRKKERTRIADYVVQIPHYKAADYEKTGLITSISDIEELYFWSGPYSETTGIITDAEPEFVF
jgi:CRISPR-associated endonuclease/helicase Cas3